MAQLQVQSILALMSEKNLKPSTKIEFSLAGSLVTADSIKVQAFAESSYSSHAGYILISISDEWIQTRVQERMRELACAQVDAMFKPKETT